MRAENKIVMQIEAAVRVTTTKVRERADHVAVEHNRLSASVERRLEGAAGLTVPAAVPAGAISPGAADVVVAHAGSLLGRTLLPPAADHVPHTITWGKSMMVRIGSLREGALVSDFVSRGIWARCVSRGPWGPSVTHSSTRSVPSTYSLRLVWDHSYCSIMRLQKELRSRYQTRTLRATTAAKDYLSAVDMTLMYAEELDHMLKPPEGLAVAKASLVFGYLLPSRGPETKERDCAPLTLHIILPRMIPRWNEVTRDAATEAFLTTAHLVGDFGTKQTEGEANGQKLCCSLPLTTISALTAIGSYPRRKGALTSRLPSTP